MMLRYQLPAIAAAAEARGNAAMRAGDDALAEHMFRVTEAADLFWLVLIEDAETERMVEEMVRCVSGVKR